ncbi:Putative small integral membrane protein OS=Streptomyces griseomycini OX=66895 GN=FHS37_004281 PE=4 SV=1 [Streptomyces griseomycini]
MSTTTPRGALPLAATLLTASVALYITLVAFGNITDFGTNREFVRHVLAMDMMFKDDDLMWRAKPARGCRTRPMSRSSCGRRRRRWSWCGHLAVGRPRPPARPPRHHVRPADGMLLFGAGFIAIGGEWFAMWQSEDWNGLDAAAPGVPVLSGVVLIVVHLPGAQDGRTDPA